MSSNTYQVLLILTDGVIHDMDLTKKLIVSCSHFPCSIIIVGVGHADFEQMDELDGDGALLKDSNGKTAKRDIVQFVEFNSAVKRGDLAE
jgi:hypothetical protein